MHAHFDEVDELASDQVSSKPAPKQVLSTSKLNPIQKEALDGLFENLYDESCGGNRMKMSTLSAATPLNEVNP